MSASRAGTHFANIFRMGLEISDMEGSTAQLQDAIANGDALSATRPWTPELPVWDWAGLPDEVKSSSLEDFGHRAAMIEYHGIESRGVAELRAYSMLVESLHDSGAFNSDHLRNFDVVRQIQRAEAFRRHDAIGRCILAGLWTKDSVRTYESREALIVSKTIA